MTPSTRPPVLVLPPGVRLPKRGRRGTAPTDLGDVLAQQIVYAGLPTPVREHVFAKEALGRLWRFDLAWVAKKIALEAEGVVGGIGGRHQRLDGYEEDCRKYSEAALLGWVVLRVTGRQVRSGEALRLVERALGEGRE